MPASPARSKYGNVRTLGPSPNGGQRWYASKREAAHATKLNYRCKAHLIRSWQPQYTIHLEVNGHDLGDYIVDFRVWTKSGSVEYHEIKGRQDKKSPAYCLWWLKASLAEAVEEIEILVNP